MPPWKRGLEGKLRTTTAFVKGFGAEQSKLVAIRYPLFSTRINEGGSDSPIFGSRRARERCLAVPFFCPAAMGSQHDGSHPWFAPYPVEPKKV